MYVMTRGIIVWLSLIEIVISIQITRDELNATLYNIYGEKGPVADYMFLSEDLATRAVEKGPSRERNRMTPAENRTRPSNLSTVEEALARALKDYRQDKNIREIDKLTKGLLRFYFPDEPSQTVPGRSAGGHRRHRNKSNRHRKRSGRDIEHISRINNFTSRRESRAVQLHVGASKTIHKRRFKREATTVCFSEGSEASSSDSVNLCGYCYSVLDYGSNTMPQYITSYACENEGGACMSGQGPCVQQVVYMTILQATDDSGNTWEAVEEPVFTHCTCECYSGTVVHDYFVNAT